VARSRRDRRGWIVDRYRCGWWVGGVHPPQHCVVVWQVVGVGGADVTAGGAGVPDVPRPTKVADPAPPPAVTATVAPPMSRGPSKAEQDAQFLSLITADGMTITDAGAATAGARLMCAGLAAGQSPASITAQAMANNPALSRENAQMVLAAAIQVYCPQYE
jgi:hypothetical protein